MNVHDTAHHYAELGWHVIPIPPGQKHPQITEWQKHATTNPETIDRWWSNNPGHGVGIATGPNSGVWVVDVDVANGKPGEQTLTNLEAQHGALPETYTVRTGSGGWHYYYRWDPARPIRNGKLGDGIDIRGDGGQVLAPPTIHPVTGTPYTVHNDPGIADAPDWIYQLLQPAKTPDPLDVQTDQLEAGKQSNTTPRNGSPGVPETPAEAYANRTNWTDLLTADGWTHHHTDAAGEHHWTRPGKNPREGTSATTNYEGRDCLKVFTTDADGLEPDKAYSRFGYYAATRHNGDRSAAARQLLADGYGTPRNNPDNPAWATGTPPANVNPETGEIIGDDNWPDPIPLGNANRQLPAFPIDVLPNWIADHARAVADDIQVPIDLPATIALACLSLVTAGRVVVNVGNWNTYTNLYLVVAMPPGTGKSPVFAAMTRGLEKHETEMAVATGPAIIEAETNRRIAEKASKRAEEKGDAHEAYQRQIEALNIHIPATPRLIADDATPEAMVQILAQQHGRLALLSTEGGLFDIMTGRYSDKANLDPYLQAWSGDTIRVDRVGRVGAHVQNATLTIGLTVQPAVLAALADRPELAGRGLTARFMYAVPHDNVGTRDFTTARNGNPDAATTYHRTIVGLYTDLAAYQTPGTIGLTDQATTMFRQWRQSIEVRRLPTGDLRPLAEWTTKLEASVLRLAGILHLAHGGPHHGTIDADTVAAAIRVGDYWTAHAYAVHDLWGTDDTLGAARKVLAWIHETGRTTFTLREVYRDNRRLFPRAADAIEPLALLTERGWIRPAFDGPVVVGKRGSPSPLFAVSPQNPESYPQAAAPGHMGHIDGGEGEPDPPETYMSHMSEQNGPKTDQKGPENGVMRAMSHMSLEANTETHSLSLNPDSHENTPPSAHDGHSAHDSEPPEVIHRPAEAVPTPPNPDDMF